MIVPGVGPKECKMAIVGIAPTEDDEYNNEPFIGSHGNILNGKLHIAKIPRSECYMTHMMKVNPSTLYEMQADLPKWIELMGEEFGTALKNYKKPKKKNDFSNLWVSKRPTLMLEYWKKNLLTELEGLTTNVVLALGPEALWALTGKSSIKKWRGSILECTLPSGKKLKVIGSYSPATINRQWDLNPILGFDINRAAADSEFPELRLPKREYIIKPSMSMIEEYYEKSKSATALAYDIETCPTGITCISFATSKYTAISIPTTVQYWGGHDELLRALRYVGLLLQTDAIKIAQNATFDIQYIGRFWGIIPSGPWFDTMIAQHSCYTELQKGLDFLASVYTREPYYKDVRKTITKGTMSDDDVLWTYNATDSAVTYEVYEALLEEMEDLKVRPVYDYMMELLEPLLFMMLKGLDLDRKALEIHKIEYKEKLEKSTAEFEEKFPGVNPHSPKQVAELAYKTLKLKPITKAGRVTTDKKAMDKLAKRNPDVAKVVKIRSDRKMISTYLEVDTDAVDDKLRFSLNSAGTTTGRLSSSASIFGSGNNLQNWPKSIRNIVVPSKPNYVFTEFDLKGAEAMVVAYLCEDVIMQKLIDDGVNIHTYTATKILWPELSNEDIEQDKIDCKESGLLSKYDIAKRVRHGSNYLMTWVTMADVVKCTASEAKIYLQRFYQKSPNLTAWHREIEADLKARCMLVTPLGRKRFFFGRLRDILKDAVAFVPQETVAHIMNIGLCRVYDKLCSHRDVNLVNTVHDSGLLEHPPEMAEEIHKELLELTRVDVRIKGRDFFIPIDISMGKNWGDMKEVKIETN